MAYNIYLASFIPVFIFSLIMWLDIFKKPQYGDRPSLLLFSIILITCLGIIQIPFYFLESLFSVFLFFSYYYFLTLGYMVVCLVLEYSINCQRIKKSFLLADFKVRFKRTLSLFLVLLLYPLASIFIYIFEDALSSLNLFNIPLTFVVLAKLIYLSVFILLNFLCINYLFNLQAGVIRRQRYPFYTLIMVACVFFIHSFFDIQYQSFSMFSVFGLVNIVFIIRVYQEYFFKRTAHLTLSVNKIEKEQQYRNKLMKTIFKSPMEQDNNIINATIQERLDKIRSKLVVKEYGITGVLLYRKEDNILKIISNDHIIGYCTPLTEYQSIKHLNKDQLNDIIMKKAFNLKRIENTADLDITDSTEKYIKKMLSTKEKVVVSPIPAFLKGLQRFIALYPLLDNDSLEGILIIYKDSFNNIFPEEENDLYSLIENLKLIFMVIQGKNIQKDRNRLQNEMDIAKRIQTSIIPKEIRIKGYDCACTMITASEVGGDVFDYMEGDNSYYYLGIGDVSGHGLPAGIVALIQMAAFHSAVNTAQYLNRELGVEQLYEIVNKVLFVIKKDRIGSDKFMTQNYLMTKDDVFTHAGTHEIALLYKKTENKVYEIRDMANKAAFMGFIPVIKCKESVGTFTMKKGDILILYTDGLIEARNHYMTQFDIDNLKNTLQKSVDMAPKQIIDCLLNAVHEHAKDGDLKKHNGYYADDISLLILKKK